MAINETVKGVWLAALRSGEYVKTEGVLFLKGNDERPDCHCALGVLCEEAVKAGVITADESAYGNDRFFPDGQPGAARLVPDAVAEWAGLGDFAEHEARVARNNDGGFGNDPGDGASSFEELADFIEERF